MTRTLRTFTHGLIDYAGLFPPARLSLDEALDQFVRHTDSSERFMLGRFVVPAYSIEALAEMRAERSVEPLRVSVICRAADNSAALAATLGEDLQLIRAAEENSGGAVRAEVVEVKLPGDAAEQNALLEVFEVASQRKGLQFYFEVPLVDGGLDAAYAVVDAVEGASQLSAPGVKLRCGGLVAEAFPSASEVAHVIAACCDANVPFKATAGLHHPVRHRNSEIPAWEHGFLNVFGAAALAHTLRLAPSQIEAIIRETRLDRFVADHEHFGWTDLLINNEQLAEARTFATSYGSCSFDEPVADLRSAGWLEAQVA